MPPGGRAWEPGLFVAEAAPMPPNRRAWEPGLLVAEAAPTPPDRMELPNPARRVQFSL